MKYSQKWVKEDLVFKKIFIILIIDSHNKIALFMLKFLLTNLLNYKEIHNAITNKS